MRVFHVDKNCDMWNFAIEEHLKLDNCSWTKFESAKERKKEELLWHSHCGA